MQKKRLCIVSFGIIATVFLCFNHLYGRKVAVLTLSSPAFEHDMPIPKEYTCEGNDYSPELRISNVPTGTKSLLLIVSDPDAPDPAAPKMTWIHWIVANLPPETTVIPKGFGGTTSIITKFPSAIEGKTSWEGKTTFGGPCPPVGTHRYIFEVYALDAMLDLPGAPTLDDVMRAMNGHQIHYTPEQIAKGTLIGTYKKQAS